MLEGIKEYIKNIPDVPFEVFYQQYVARTQDSILSHDVTRASQMFNNIEDTTQVLKGLNTLTEELKRL